MRRRLLQIALALAGVYVVVCAGLFVAMRQPPRVFDRVMARMPAPAYLVLPFRPMWMVARAGSLEVGDPAPDFSLETVDRKSRVQLSSHRGQKLVVLVFGSYT
jgi:hypothetical protein